MDDLTYLFSAYFYEAWDEYEYGSWQDAVDDFARRSPERVAGVMAALRALLDEPLTDKQLDARLRTRGCTFVSEDGDRTWLIQLLDRLQASPRARRALRGDAEELNPELD
ncbi:contact-dependent growth inhibition system immunity protein [Nocardioides sp. T5]|uniref:contact-dependent growth inhibition system immunity protein n=1 Tax=Nocardioides sp. T5 TaxID=3400182 RepID=UPI003A89E1F7